MGAVTSMAVAGGISALGGAYQAIQGAKQARDAKLELERLQTPELMNVADNLTVSTLGSNLQREEASRNYATSVDALRSAGARGIIGGLGVLNQNQNTVNRQIAADLDTQQKAIDMARAEDEARIRAIKEQRYANDVAALSSQINAGESSKMQGLMGIGQGISSGVQGAVSQRNLEGGLYGNKSGFDSSMLPQFNYINK
jgi:hypothetical protein